MRRHWRHNRSIEKRQSAAQEKVRPKRNEALLGLNLLTEAPSIDRAFHRFVKTAPTCVGGN